MIVVPDANTLIYLAKADLLHVLDPYTVWVGEVVYEEAVERGKAEGWADAFILERHVERRFQRKPLKDRDAFAREMAYFRGRGETNVFLLARDADCTAVTSDRVARRRLRARGVHAVRTDMLIYRQFQDSGLTRPDLDRHLIQLRSVGGTTDARLRFLLSKADERET